MIRLLASVRDGAEAQAAVRGGADLIDIKEPVNGPLGRASAARMDEVVQAVAGRCPMSVALGEWDEAAPSLPNEAFFVKLGLARAAPHADWGDRWGARLRALPVRCQPVAVIYADWYRIDAPSPWEVIHRGAELGCCALLVDTHDKDRGNVFQVWREPELAPLLQQVRGFGWTIVLAGSVSQDADLELVRQLAPDYLALRTAICRDGRLGAVCEHRVRAWKDKLQSSGR